MSMLSAQVDELRTMAESVSLAMPRAATLMMEAADTIWELRGSVHRERAENANLRELLLDYDKMLSIAADELAYKSGVLRMDSVLNALRIRTHELGIEVDG